MKRVLVLLLTLFATSALAQATLLPAPKSALDGTWKCTSDGGSCNAPLDIQLSIEYGFVDGTALDTSAKGPVPNQSKEAPPAPTPGLWQLHGTAHSGESFTLVAAASVRYGDRRDGRMTVKRDGAGLVLTEETGCRRTARLSR